MSIEFITRKGDYNVFVDLEDADLANVSWGVSGTNGGRYASRTGSKRQVLHRIVMERKIGRPLQKGEYVDHINGNTFDNTRTNLRIGTASQNNMNSRIPRTNTSGYKGVTFHKRNRKWQAGIMVNKRHIYLGLFETPEEAHNAYCKAAMEYFGEFARFE